MPWNSAMSASIGVIVDLLSSSSNRELRRLFALALVSRRGRLAGVTGSGTGAGDADDERLSPRNCSNDDGGGGSCAVRGDGSTSGITSNCCRYRYRASVGNVVKSIWKADVVSQDCI